MKIPQEFVMYVRSMGKALRVTAMFDNDADANDYMEKNRDQGVIACLGNHVFLANLYDRGADIGESVYKRGQQ